MHAVKHCGYGLPCFTRKNRFTYVFFSLRKEREKFSFIPSCRRKAPKLNELGFPPLPTGSPQFFLSLWAKGGAFPPRSGAWRAGSSPAPTQLPGLHCAAVPVRCHGNWQPYQTKRGERQKKKLKGLTFLFSEDWVVKLEGTSLGFKAKTFRVQGNGFLGFKSKSPAN